MSVSVYFSLLLPVVSANVASLGTVRTKSLKFSRVNIKMFGELYPRILSFSSKLVRLWFESVSRHKSVVEWTNSKTKLESHWAKNYMSR